jgi:hypothetical protein
MRAFPDAETTFTTMYHAALPDYGKIIITTPVRWKSLEEAEEELSGEFERASHCEMPGITVLKSATGIGKSECMLQYIREGTVALPRHDLIQSMSQRYEQRGVEPFVLPEFPYGSIPVEFQKQLFELWATGCYGQAQEYLRTLGMMGWSNELTQYLEAKEHLKST